jgi:UDP-3-O-[3-hydroxymyristoyl] glucosamine N-acyltransferase
VYDDCTFGHRVIIHAGAVVGADGYGYRLVKGKHERIPQLGGVVIEDDVEVGANTTIDAGTFGPTRIGTGTKIDNLVQIAHGVELGERVILVSQVGIAGSTTIGAGTVLAGQVGVAGHLSIGAGVRATAQTGIPNSLPDKAFVSGYPAIENRDWLKASAIFRSLPALRKQVADLQRRIAALEAAGQGAADPEPSAGSDR